MPPQTNSPLRDRPATRGRSHAPVETAPGRATAGAALIAFAAIAWTAVTAAIDLHFGREAWQNSFGTSRDLTTILILATFSAPALFVWGACAAACWQQFRRERSFEPDFDRTARPERPALSEGSLGAAAMNAWMAGLAAVFVLAVVFELGLILPRWAIAASYFAAVAAAGLATLVKSWRPPLSSSERWQRLAKKTRWTPFFTRPVISREPRGLVIRERWGLRLLLAPAFLGGGMFGFLAFWRDPFGTLDHTPGAVLALLQFMLAGFVLVAVHCLREQPSLACSLSPPHLTVSYGWLPRPERFAFDPREMGVLIALDGAAVSASQTRQRPALLLTRREQSSQPIRLAGAEYYPNLRELFEPLAEMLGGPSSDQTIAEIELPGGGRLQVSRTPRCDGACYRKLRFVGRDRARASATWGIRIFYSAILGSGCLFVAGGAIPWGQFDLDWKGYLGAAVFALFGAAAAAIGAGGLLFETSTLIDRRRGCVEIGAPPWRKPRSIRLADVAAIQICSAPQEDSPPTYQLNWVLASPEGRRLPILDGHKPQLVERWARELGEFLDKPVLDHRVG